MRYGLQVYERVRAMGGNALLLDYGRGSVHLWVPLDGGVRGTILHLFGKYLVRDWREHGFAVHAVSAAQRRRYRSPVTLPVLQRAANVIGAQH